MLVHPDYCYKSWSSATNSNFPPIPDACHFEQHPAGEKKPRPQLARLPGTNALCSEEAHVKRTGPLLNCVHVLFLVHSYNTQNKQSIIHQYLANSKSPLRLLLTTPTTRQQGTHYNSNDDTASAGPAMRQRFGLSQTLQDKVDISFHPA